MLKKPSPPRRCARSVRPAGPLPERTSVDGLTKMAARSLRKSGLEGQVAEVYLVLDRSRSMRPYYQDGTVQYLAERVLGLSRNLDADGRVPVVFFSTEVDGTTEVSVDAYAGRIEAAHSQLGVMGSTRYSTAMTAVIERHRASGSTAPALVVFQTDGSPTAADRAETKRLMRESADEGIFWLFLTFGKRVDFLRTLEHVGLDLDHIGRFGADDPHHIDDGELYDGITEPFERWLHAA